MATVKQRISELEKRTGGADDHALVVQYVRDWGRPTQRPLERDDAGLDALAQERGWRKIGPARYVIGGAR